MDQFLSDISVLGPQGAELTRKSISVNDPLRFRVRLAWPRSRVHPLAAPSAMAPSTPRQPLRSIALRGVRQLALGCGTARFRVWVTARFAGCGIGLHQAPGLRKA